MTQSKKRSTNKKLAVLVSGRGSNLQAIIDAKKFSVSLVLSDKKEAKALSRAAKVNIPAFHVSKKDRDLKILSYLKEHEIDLVVLAGYLKKVGDNILEEYENRIINIHPSLLPKFGGVGMYGLNVHQAVLDNKENESGATVHYVTKEYDQGEIIVQERVAVLESDTAESLAKRVLEVEHRILVEGIVRVLRKFI